MQTPKRRLRPYREVVRDAKFRRRLSLREADNQSDVTDNLRYYVTALPKDVTQSEKMARLSELADIITNVENSDVCLIAVWID
jgi:hypothetical protein